ncbi:hypothetical protein LWI28_009442 [Acer negundo]|uniref:Uncharacterized protein n=1 Tax=Acer negundo TaxID=4023 RepID=A0AAD5IDX9_ACENE|nr:hypothetical protein LWI28_009442 [Acer negundo]
MSALGRPQDMFSDTAIQLQPVFTQWIQNTHALAPGGTAPGATASTSLTWGGGDDLVAVSAKLLVTNSIRNVDFWKLKAEGGIRGVWKREEGGRQPSDTTMKEGGRRLDDVRRREREERVKRWQRRKRKRDDRVNKRRRRCGREGHIGGFPP